MKEDTKINPKTFEWLIVEAINKKAYIEIITLTHNVIELYLRYRIERYISKIDDCEVYDNSKKIKIIHGKAGKNYLKYLLDYLEISFLFNIVDETIYDQILKFNERRNKIVHTLAKSDIDKGLLYSELIKVAKLGRQLQLKLSPLNHSDKDIETIMYYFDHPEDAETSMDDFRI